jgi:hypothetical protein
MRRIAEKAEHDCNQQSTQQHLYRNKVQPQRHDMQQLDQPYGRWQRNGIYSRKRLHEVVKEPLSWFKHLIGEGENPKTIALQADGFSENGLYFGLFFSN